jgi:hypothetical protein
MRIWIAFLAREHVMRRRSQRIEMVIILYFGTSARSLSYVDCSKRTWLLAFSLFFPLDHFFFLALPPAWALAALAAFDSGAFGGCEGEGFGGGSRQRDALAMSTPRRRTWGAREGGFPSRRPLARGKRNGRNPKKPARWGRRGRRARDGDGVESWIRRRRGVATRGAASRRDARGVARRRRRRDARAKPHRPRARAQRFPSRARSETPETRADAIVARAAAATARENDGNAWKRDEKTHHLDNT